MSKSKKYNSIKKKSKDKNDKNIDSVDFDEEKPKVASDKIKRATAARQSKIGGIIEAFESNMVGDKASSIKCDDKKDKKRIENAFSKLMKSSIGESTPSPKRKKPKRLDKGKPLGMKKLENWFKKE